MKRIGGFRRVKISADGRGVVSHAGVGLLREMAEQTGLVDAVSAALLDTYKGQPVHPPGRVFTDLAVAIADGADAISGIAVLGDRTELFGQVASMPTTWRVLDRIDAVHLSAVRDARARARAVCQVPGLMEGLNSREAGCFGEAGLAVQGLVLDRWEQPNLAVKASMVEP
ncbi:MAG: transposase, partial [Mycobacteriales bacterium]|nr:transposase [Mycobacteriales bacterium]